MLRALVTLLFALSIGCGSGGHCEDLASALAAAAPGDTVQVGSCEVVGSFDVPAGVSLEGTGASVLSSLVGGAPVVSLTGESTVRNLAVHVDGGGVGVRANGAAEPRLEDLTITVTRGIGIGLDGIGAHVERVRLEGAIDASNAVSASSDPAETSAFGLVARDLGGAALSIADLYVSGFSVAGVLAEDATITWTDADADPDVVGNRGFGVALFGGSATLGFVGITRMLAGPGLSGVGLAISGEAAVLEATALEVSAGVGYGLFGDRATITLEGARFVDLGGAAIRLQRGALTATNLTSSRNHGAGVLAIDATSIDLEASTIEGTVTTGLASEVAFIPVGDGIQVVRATASTAPALDLRLASVSLRDNERAGLVIDAADGSVGRIAIDDVSTSGPGLGAVAVRTAVPAGWDASVSRDATTAANDLAFAGTIDVLGIMMPPGLTPPSF